MKRIQRRRTAGWTMPADTTYVGRPSRFGNPFHAAYLGHDEAVRLYRQWLDGVPGLIGYLDAEDMRQRILDGLPTLTGRDLACWCPPDKACHADVLLELANPAGEA